MWPHQVAYRFCSDAGALAECQLHLTECASVERRTLRADRCCLSVCSLPAMRPLLARGIRGHGSHERLILIHLRSTAVGIDV